MPEKTSIILLRLLDNPLVQFSTDTNEILAGKSYKFLNVLNDFLILPRIVPLLWFCLNLKTFLQPSEYMFV